MSILLAYAPTAQARVSTDANLSALTLQVDGQPLTLTPTFSSGATAYTASVASAVPWLTVTPTANDSGATITVSRGAVASGVAGRLLLLNVGSNAIPIVVTAADGSTKTYTVTVTRDDAGCGRSTGINPRYTRLLAECATLLGLKDELQGTANLNWAPNVDIATWNGVTLSADRPRSLNRLVLNDYQLTGSIPPELGSLTNLWYLNLNDNQLTDRIPPELGRLTSLRDLNLSDNRLTGSIPPELGSLRPSNLWLHCNELTGGIPTDLAAFEFDFLSRILFRSLWLQGNPPRHRSTTAWEASP